MTALPWPATGGKIGELRRFLNLTREQELLALSWLLAALRPEGPYPILAVTGIQGSSKSTLLKVLRSLTDPSRAPLRTAPRNELDLMIAAKHSRLLTFDNLSDLKPALSDSLCRLATGGGLGKRSLYTDEKETLFAACRPVAFNAIASLASRGDLLDRIVALDTAAIAPASRKLEADFWADFNAARPKLLGALLDTLVLAMRAEPRVKLTTPPRVADFAKWSIAAEQGLGFKAGDFMRAYDANRTESGLYSLDCSPAAALVVKFMADKDTWIGTCTALLLALNKMTTTDQRDSDWPRSARKMAEVLARAEPNLLIAGIRVTRLSREGGTGSRRIKLERIVTSSHRHEAA